LSKVNAPLPDRRYPIILADPPWSFEVYDASSGLDNALLAEPEHGRTIPLTDERPGFDGSTIRK
jgi:hypothetical protein